MKILYNTTMKITNLNEDKYTKLIDFLEDGYITYEENDFEEFTIDERTEEEKYEDWKWEQADLYNDELKMGLRE